jgi:putative RecB family exonuclease
VFWHAPRSHRDISRNGASWKRVTPEASLEKLLFLTSTESEHSESVPSSTSWRISSLGAESFGRNARKQMSVSQMNLYLLCSLKYRFQYLDELPKPFRSSALAFGGAFHAALAWYHDHAVEGNGATLETLMKIYEADWFAQKTGAKIFFGAGETEAKLSGMAREMLRLYVERPQSNIQAAEVAFSVPLENPATGERLEIGLEGFFDLVTGNDAIVEFKTSGQSMSNRDADNHLQLTAYSYAFEMLNQRPAKALRIVDFVKNKIPKMIVLDTSRTAKDHQRFFHFAREVLNGIRTGVFLPRTGYWCRDCEYAKSCQAWQGN